MRNRNTFGEVVLGLAGGPDDASESPAHTGKEKKMPAKKTGELGGGNPAMSKYAKGTAGYKRAKAYQAEMGWTGRGAFLRAVQALERSESGGGGKKPMPLARRSPTPADVTRVVESDKRERNYIKGHAQSFLAPWTLRSKGGESAVADLLQAAAVVLQTGRLLRGLAGWVPGSSAVAAAAGQQRVTDINAGNVMAAGEFVLEPLVFQQVMALPLPPRVKKLVGDFLAEKNIGMRNMAALSTGPNEPESGIHMALVQFLRWLPQADATALIHETDDYVEATELKVDASWAKSDEGRLAAKMAQALDAMFQLPGVNGARASSPFQLAGNGIAEVDDMRWPGNGGAGVNYGQPADVPHTIDDVRSMLARGPLGANATDADLDLFLSADAFADIMPPRGLGEGEGRYDRRANPQVIPTLPSRTLLGEPVEAPQPMLPARAAAPVAQANSGAAIAARARDEFVPFHLSAGGDDDELEASFS